MGGRVWVVDASALIDCKQRIPVGRQWEFFKALEEMVIGGAIALPRQVINEVTGGRWPDAPGVWAGGMRSKFVHSLDAPLALVRAVLDETPLLIEDDATEDVGDPYVLAMALALIGDGYEPMIVTEDRVDRLPLKMSMRSAAAIHRLECCGLLELATFVGVDCKRVDDSHPD